MTIGFMSVDRYKWINLRFNNQSNKTKNSSED